MTGYFEATGRVTWNCADQQDTLLQSCISWAEQSRTTWYREFSRKLDGKAPNHVPRLNRVFIRLREEHEWPSQGDIFRARSWIAWIGNRSIEIHSDIALIRWDAEDKPVEIPVARVQTVRVFLLPMTEQTRAVLQDMLMEAPTPTEPSWKPYVDKPAGEDLRVVSLRTRPSDIDAMQHVNNAMYPRLLMNAFWTDTNDPVKYVKRMDVEYVSEVPAGMDIELAIKRSDSGGDAVRFVLLRDRSSGKVLNVSRWEFDMELKGTIRYNRVRPGRMAPELLQYAVARIDTPAPVRAELYIGWEETSTASAFALNMLKWGDSAIIALWAMLGIKSFIPPRELFGKHVIVMQRSTVGRVFKRPVSGRVLVSESWLSRMGTSSIEFYTQFRDKETGEMCFAMKITKVVVDLKTGKKADKLFFDTTHFAKLYDGLQTVDIPEPKCKPPAMNDSSLAFTYRPLLRHQDQDTLGHINSYVYMNHVHDARGAWQDHSGNPERAGLTPIGERNKAYVSDSWLDSFGIDFMGENKKGEDLVMRHYRPADPQDPNLSWFMIDDASKGKTRTRIWTREMTRSDEFTPFTLDKPKFFADPKHQSRAEGVNMNMCRDEEEPLPVVKAVADVDLSSSSSGATRQARL